MAIPDFDKQVFTAEFMARGYMTLEAVVSRIQDYWQEEPYGPIDVGDKRIVCTSVVIDEPPTDSSHRLLFGNNSVVEPPDHDSRYTNVLLHGTRVTHLQQGGAYDEEIGPIARIEVRPLSRDDAPKPRFLIRAYCADWPRLDDYLASLRDYILSELSDTDGQAVEVSEPTAAPRRRVGPTDRTRLRFELYKSIKDRTPSLGYAAVARKANEEERSDVHSEDTVRNAYRAMGVKWERADRIR